MKIEPKAFIAIEKTMAAAMQSQWDVVARGLLDHIHPLLEAKKWGDAQAAVNRLSLAGVVADVRPKIEEMCVSALLFGAHHATGNVKATSFAKGKAIPQELHNAIAQLEHMVEANGRDYVCNQLHAAIEAMKRADAASHLQKHDIYTEPDKRPDHQIAEDNDPEADPEIDGETARRQEKFLGQAAHQYKADPYHDAEGKFTSADNAAAAVDAAPEHPAGPNFMSTRDVGMKVADGYRLRVPNITKKLLRDAPTKEFDLRTLLTGQAYLVRSTIKDRLAQGAEAHKDKQYTVLHQDGEYILLDGNHTAATMLLLGHPIIKAKVVEAKEPGEQRRKDDLSEGQLAETGGLLEPEQAEAAPKKKRKVKKGDKTLYVHRDLQNPEPFLAWAKAQGFKTTLPVDDLHVTVLYSKTPVDWAEMDRDDEPVYVDAGGPRAIHQFNKGAVVLQFKSSQLSARNAQFLEAGATSDFPDFKAHVTITYDKPEDLDLADVEPYDGLLEFGPEIFQEIKGKGWSPDDMEEEVLKWERLFKADESLADKLNRAVATGGKVAVDTGAQLTTSRLVTLGFLAEAVENDVATYQVNEVLDDKTCPVCEYMNGKTFDVRRQYERTIQQLSAADPDALRSLAPWPGQSEADLAHLQSLSLEELQANGFGAPPYHPGCRGMTMLVGSTTETIPLGGHAPEPEEDVGLTHLVLPGEEAETSAPLATETWDAADIEKLKWERFDILDAKVQAKISDLIDAGDYAEAQEEIDAWKSQHVAKDDEDGSEGPNAPKKKGKKQRAAGEETDYEDIHSDSSSIAFDNSGLMNDANAPIDRV